MKTLNTSRRWSSTVYASRNCKYAMSREIKEWAINYEYAWITILEDIEYPEDKEDEEDWAKLQSRYDTQDWCVFVNQFKGWVEGMVWSKRECPELEQFEARLTHENKDKEEYHYSFDSKEYDSKTLFIKVMKALNIDPSTAKHKEFK